MRPRTTRRADKSLRRQELIEATIDSLAKRGFDATTTAVVADGAGLSRGIVNFHFESKEKLLVETLRYLSDEYRTHWRSAVNAAGPDPAARLWALAAADFDRKVCTQRKLAAWGAFWGEAKSRPTYRELCSPNDVEYQNTVADLVRQLVRPGQDYRLLARGLDCMLNGLWHHLMISPREFKREEAWAVARMHLATVFPDHFTDAGPIVPDGRPDGLEGAG
ncbi:TetR family transcriptional regulator C-terminal domain-containing protein [Microbaculum marinum]|uniref:TetR family transcriptional regulator C-terminal domain-containing protein n=1 Tax=Microbaculum marinum TaxID=1764581 RepID=A0AAW9RRP7_9HYPH